jgi:hypothetical protein
MSVKSFITLSPGERKWLKILLWKNLNVAMLDRLFSKHLTQFGTVGVRANAIVTKVAAC